MASEIGIIDIKTSHFRTKTNIKLNYLQEGQDQSRFLKEKQGEVFAYLSNIVVMLQSKNLNSVFSDRDVLSY